MKKKHLLITGAVVAVLGTMAFVGKSKKDELSATMDRLRIRLSGFDWNALRFKDGNIEAKIDLRIINPTPNDFSFSGLGMAQLRRVFIQGSNGQIIAQSNLNKPSIDIPANGNIELKNIKITGFTKAILSLMSLGLDQIKTGVDLDVLGSTYTILNYDDSKHY